MSAFWQSIKQFFDKVIQLFCQGAITRAGGDTDEFDVIDHKTGKPRKP